MQEEQTIIQLHALLGNRFGIFLCWVVGYWYIIIWFYFSLWNQILLHLSFPLSNVPDNFKTQDPLWIFSSVLKMWKWYFCFPSTNIFQFFWKFITKHVKIMIIMSLHFLPQLDILFPYSLYTKYESFIFRARAIISLLFLCPCCAAECLKCNDLSISSPNYSNPPPTIFFSETVLCALCHFLKFSPRHTSFIRDES